MNLSEIIMQENFALSKVIIGWKDYTNDEVLFSYCELKRREVYSFVSKQVKKALEDFAINNNSDVDAMVLKLLQFHGVGSYLDMYLKVTTMSVTNKNLYSGVNNVNISVNNLKAESSNFEDKLDNIGLWVKIIGIIGAMVGFYLFYNEDSCFFSCVVFLSSIFSAFGTALLLSIFSEIIRLLRRISNKN